jgi:hypothetical protein
MYIKTYQEKQSTASSNGKEYDLNILFKRTKNKQSIDIPIHKLTWVLEYTSIDEQRVKNADVSVPVLVYHDEKDGLVVIDGAHRLTKAFRLKMKVIPGVMLSDEDMEAAEINKKKIALLSDSNNVWQIDFGPSYTPKEMLELGVFEGKYVNNMKGIPADWKKSDKVLGPDDEPDPSVNKYGVKSRQPLSVWKKNGWIKTDPNGFFEWMCNYYLGRRLGEEDEWQIKRWRSFVARHQAQIKADTKGHLKDRRLAQKQGLLQWGWDWEQNFTDKNVTINAKRIAKSAGAKLDKEESALENMVLPAFARWV